jgi:hypothetical protein
MGAIRDLGTRVELLSMDPYFHDISIALYRRELPSGPEYLVHSYSRKEGIAGRLASLSHAMVVLGGLQAAGGENQWLRFPCGAAHQNAARRIFLEVCKMNPGAEPAARPLSTPDKKSGLTITALSVGSGMYQVEAGDGEEARKRASGVASGLVKLAEMARVGTEPERFAFECGYAHDAAIGLLLVRALNVRVALRDEEMATTRGVLVAPSAQR